jgi:DNA replication licensing factor MCM7
LRLVESVTNNTKHYVDLFSDAVDKVLPKESKDISYVVMD